jgi:hypothetical protein
MVESCESKIANLLSSFDNLPDRDVHGKLALLAKCVEIQVEEIRMLKKEANRSGA